MVRATLFSFTVMLLGASATPVFAQPPVPQNPAAERAAEFRLSDTAASNTSVRRAQADAAAHERRQRAAFHAQQRALRMEANAWLGVTPLRPSWPSVPYTHSYYQPGRVIYYPVTVNAN
jgi:hypothetical protein